MTMSAHEKKIPLTQVSSGSLYEAEEKIYPREITGYYQSIRKVCVFGVLALFYGLAWLPWQGKQAVLFDLPARQFSIFGLQFWPQDFYLLTWLLIIAALALFTVTALAGRLWCGFACPQTVWTELFLWLERVTEGTYSQRRKRDTGPWNLDKILRKSLKQFLWISLALWTGFTFVGYFTPIKTLSAHVWERQLGGWESFWILFYGFATYGNAGFLREQVCKYMCPYARFQSAMLDQDSLVISYDATRGEPRKRGNIRAINQTQKAGDCIDCQICVQVCPTGIDIRQGLQYECIGCAACIDACNQVMRRIGKPLGLIRYTSEQALTKCTPSSSNQNNASNAPPLSERQLLIRRLFRPRMLLYGTLLAALSLAFIAFIYLRAPTAVDILRDRRAFYQEVIPGSVDNIYTIKLMNKQAEPQIFSLSLLAHDEAVLLYQPQPLVVEGGEDFDFSLRIRLPNDGQLHGPQPMTLLLTEQQTQHVTKVKTLFWFPESTSDGH